MRPGRRPIPLMYASSGPYPESVRLLLEWNADPLAVDGEEQFTALMYAAAEGQADVLLMPEFRVPDTPDGIFAAIKERDDRIQVLIENVNNLDRAYEFAERLSYFVWADMPDDKLLAAARDRRLETPRQIRACRCHKLDACSGLNGRHSRQRHRFRSGQRSPTRSSSRSSGVAG